jgi:multimeric flavodoxin WrbA
LIFSSRIKELEIVMSRVAIVDHSGYGHTKALAEAVAAGAGEVPDTKVSLVPVNEAEAREAELDAADAIIFGSPTYLGGVSAEFARFKDWTSKRWMSRTWQDKLAAGFTGSAAWNGDKHNTLYQFVTLAAQHGMVWVGLGLPPGNNHSKGSSADLNRTGASIGAMAQANADQGIEGIGASDFQTMKALGRRVAQAAQRWRIAPLAKAA